MTTDLVFATSADVCQNTRLPYAFQPSIESRLAQILCSLPLSLSLSLSNRPATLLTIAGLCPLREHVELALVTGASVCQTPAFLMSANLSGFLSIF
jgi:hypothetical protein